MNTQKLDALASQAGFDVVRLRSPHPSGFPREDMLALESFAELIVKECAEVVKWTPSVFPNDTIIKNIKEHFGVEE
jgi:hypothetical protein